MKFVVNEQIISEIYCDKLSVEIEEYLNLLIDKELEKENIDTDFIDACINAIDDLRVQKYNTALKLVLSEKRVIKYCKKQVRKQNAYQKKAVAACIIIALSSSAVMLNSNTAFANQVKEMFSRIIYELKDVAGESDDENNLPVSSIYAIFPKDYSFEIKSKDDIDLQRITIKAVYQDNSEKTVSIDDCTIKVVENVENAADKILVVIGYDGCAFSVAYTIMR